jgi:hypothetical protein
MAGYDVQQMKDAIDQQVEAQTRLQKVGFELQQAWLTTGVPPTDEQWQDMTKAVREVQDCSATLQALLVKAGWPRNK